MQGVRASARRPGTARARGRAPAAPAPGARPSRAGRGRHPGAFRRSPARSAASRPRTRGGDWRRGSSPRAAPPGDGPRRGAAQGAPRCRGRSPLATIAVEAPQQFRERQARPALRQGGSGVERRPEQALPDRLGEQRVVEGRGSSGGGGADSATTWSRSVTRTTSPRAARRTYSLRRFFSALMPTAFMSRM